MSIQMSTQAQKVYDFFKKNPDARATTVAAKYKMSASHVYKIKANAKRDLASFPAPAPMPEPVKVLHNPAFEAPNVDKTLDVRAQMYGKFKDGAALMQAIKRAIADHAAKHGKTFADDQWEALEMIVHKIGRIVNGDPDVTDHWVDIAGYATLIAERLEGHAR